MQDFIEAYLATTKGMPSPRIFRLWAAISCLAGALERRVWTTTMAGHTYPNIWCTLTGSPGSGKSIALIPVRELWSHTKGLHLGPANVTPPRFIDCLEEALRMVDFGDALPHMYCALSLCCREFGSFFPKYDLGFLSDMSDLYDNPPKYDLLRREAKSTIVENPTVNIITAATPGYLGELLPEAAWKQGFTSRMIFIYGNSERAYNNFFAAPKSLETSGLYTRLNDLFQACGEVLWQEDAQEEFIKWFSTGAEPCPTHGRLQEYNSRRDIHIIKLSMLSAASAGHELLVTLKDIQRAKTWLLEAEERMPDIFRSMVQKSDNQVLEDMHYTLYGIYISQPVNSRKPLKEEEVWNYLKIHVESSKIKPLIELAEKSGLLQRASFPNEWIPAPPHNANGALMEGT